MKADLHTVLRLMVISRQAASALTDDGISYCNRVSLAAGIESALNDLMAEIGDASIEIINNREGVSA